MYMLFGGFPYYPEGGFNDFDSLHDTLEEAQAAALKHLHIEEWSEGWWSWSHVTKLSWGDKLEIWKYDERTEEWGYAFTQLKSDEPHDDKLDTKLRSDWAQYVGSDPGVLMYPQDFIQDMEDVRKRSENKVWSKDE